MTTQEPPPGIACGGSFFCRPVNRVRPVAGPLLISLALHLVVIGSSLRIQIFGHSAEGGTPRQRVDATILQIKAPMGATGGGGQRERRNVEFISGGGPLIIPLSKAPRVAAKRADPEPGVRRSTDPRQEVPAALPAAQTAVDDESLASDGGSAALRLELARRAREFRRYPAEAKVNAWQGVVVVSIAYSGAARQQLVTLERSSGHAVLDRQALEMVEQAGRQANLPQSLLGRRFRLSLPVEFSLME